MRHITIIISSHSEIFISGLQVMLSNNTYFSNAIIITNPQNLQEAIETHSPSVAIVDTSAFSPEIIRQIRSKVGDLWPFTIGIYALALTQDEASTFDAILSIYANKETILSTIESSVASNDPEESNELTPREKEVVIGVVKGLSNKEIAAEINVSVNTVMTHRRNIASKLQIHSPAGLTVYAMMSNLLTIDEIKQLYK